MTDSPVILTEVTPFKLSLIDVFYMNKVNVFKITSNIEESKDKITSSVSELETDEDEE